MGYTIKKQLHVGKKESRLIRGWEDEPEKLEKYEDQMDVIQRILDLMNATIDKGWEFQTARFCIKVKDTNKESKLLFVNIDKNWWS